MMPSNDTTTTTKISTNLAIRLVKWASVTSSFSISLEAHLVLSVPNLTQVRSTSPSGRLKCIPLFIPISPLPRDNQTVEALTEAAITTYLLNCSTTTTSSGIASRRGSNTIFKKWKHLRRQSRKWFAKFVKSR